MTKSTKERLIVLETQKEELESKISLEKVRQIKPLEVDKVKTFLNYFARKKYKNDQEKNEFFNSFINRVILYDDKVLIFYNTDANHPTVIKREENDEIAASIENETSSLTAKTKKNSLEPHGFKRVSLGGEDEIRTHVPGITDNRISSAARYDHFDTSP